jgi:hypothetical protein
MLLEAFPDLSGCCAGDDDNISHLQNIFGCLLRGAVHIRRTVGPWIPFVASRRSTASHGFLSQSAVFQFQIRAAGFCRVCAWRLASGTQWIPQGKARVQHDTLEFFAGKGTITKAGARACFASSHLSRLICSMSLGGIRSGTHGPCECEVTGHWSLVVAPRAACGPLLHPAAQSPDFLSRRPGDTGGPGALCFVSCH